MNLATTALIDLLPVDAAERLRAIQRTRDNNGAILRSIAERVLEARATRLDAENRLRHLTRTTRPLPPDHPSVQQAQRAMDNANAELARLANDEAVTASAFNHGSHLVTAIERWALSHTSTGRMFAPSPTIEPRLLKGENVVDAIARVKQETRRLEADLNAALSAPIPAAEAKAAARDQVAAWAARGRPFVEAAIEHGEPVTFEAQQMRASTPPVQGVAQVTVAWSQLDALGLVAWLHQDALTKRLCAEIDAAADDGAALSSADRKKREAELLGDIAMTQRQVTALIRLAEKEGIEVTFEVDTPPAIVLGIDLVDAPQLAIIDRTEEVLRQQRAVQAAGAVDGASAS